MPKYTDQTTLESYLGITFDAGQSSYVDTVLEAAEKYIEHYCGDADFGDRVFKDPGADETRYFNGNNDTVLPVGDLLSLSALEVDGVALAQNDDYYLYPLNADKSGRPFQRIELIQPETRVVSGGFLVGGSPYIFTAGQRTVSVTGRFAYSATAPSDIVLAVLKLAGAVMKENTANREVNSESTGTYTVSYQSMASTANALKVNDILNSYKREKNNAASAGLAVIS